MSPRGVVWLEGASGCTVRRSLRVETRLGTVQVTATGRALTELLFTDTPRCREPEHGYTVGDPLLEEVARQLGEYFAGRRRRFDLPVAPAGSAFDRQVWRALCEIAYGSTLTYGKLAARLGRPGAARAVGAANRRNPIAIVIPCHRVIGARGQLVGYAAGVERQRELLRLERDWSTPGANLAPGLESGPVPPRFRLRAP